MIQRLSIWLAAVALFWLPAQAQSGDANKADLDKLQGTWKMVAAEKDGRPQDMRKLDQVLVFRNQTITFIFDGKNRGAANFRIDATKKPKELDVYGDSPKNPVMLVIYEIDGDTLKYAWTSPDSQDRMEEFKTLPGAEQRIQTYKRVREK